MRTDRRSRRRSPLPKLLVAIALGALLFAVGVALGQALSDNPEAGRTRVDVRTLKPLPLPPVRETITVRGGR